MTLFDTLKRACAEDWRAYTDHAFVRGMADGTLPEACFRHYLVQDYLFLIHFARAYGLLAFKSERLSDMRAAAATMHAILDQEMQLHVRLCAEWGISEAEMEAAPEAGATMAYTRYVLERGLSGDALDLQVALSPCVIGYGEIAARLVADPATKREGNPYMVWIGEYAGEAYQQVAADAIAALDRGAEGRVTEARMPSLARTFGQATRLEAAFWQMGLDTSL